MDVSVQANVRELLRGLARRSILGAINSSANVWSLAPGENLRQQVVGFGHFGIADIEEGA